MGSRTSLKAFLATARKALASAPPERPTPLTFVVGNESADLDSLCSALLYAYFRTHIPPHTLHIPLSNLPRADLALRPELNAVLAPAGLTTNDLITLSDLPPAPSTNGNGTSEGKHPLRPEDTRWLLVDHNVLTGELASRFLPKGGGAGAGGGRIIGCVDHHDDEGVVPKEGIDVRVFARCGSCMSLVLDQCKDVWEQLSRGDAKVSAATGQRSTVDGAECDAQIAYVALAPILSDTINLTSQDKTTEWDVKAVEMAEAKLLQGKKRAGDASAAVLNGAESAGYDRTRYFQQINQLKEDILGMSYRDILRKDFKRWAEGTLAVGMSTVPQGFEYALNNVGDKHLFLSALRDWAAEQKLDIAAVMTVSTVNGVFTRELLIWGFDENAVKAVKAFKAKYGDELGLERWRNGELDGSNDTQRELRVCWIQRSIRHSRKQVAPMLREAMKDAAKL